MTKVMIVGDTHGDDSFVSNLHKEAKKEEVEVIIQLGDFGYDFNRNLLHSIYAWLDGDENRKWYWLDGNHDQHDYIRATIMDGGDSDVPIAHFHDRMFYCPRGSVVTIGEKKCQFLGGAFSIDRSYRKMFVSWWPGEIINYADVENTIRNGEGQDIDIIFCHDTPPTEWIEVELHRSGYKADENSIANRRAIGHAVDRVRPKDLYHGHYHWRYDTQYTTPDGWITDVHGVAANVNQRPGGNWLDPSAKSEYNFLIREF